MFTERTVAIVEPNKNNGVVVNVIVVASDWVNDDSERFVEFDENTPFGIGWQVVNGVAVEPEVEVVE